MDQNGHGLILANMVEAHAFADRISVCASAIGNGFVEID